MNAQLMDRPSSAPHPLLKTWRRLSVRNPPLWICPFPYSSGSNGNPYIRALSRELGNLGAVIIRHKFGLEKPLNEPPRGAIIHFHWPSRLYTSSVRKIAEERLGLWRDFLAGISRRCRIVWTAHNLFPHETSFPDLELKARKLLIAHCDHITVHCHSARGRLEAEFGSLPPVSILPHPNLLDEYPNPPDRRTARRSLQIPEGTFLFLMFGKLRDYKGIDTAIATFRQLDLPHVRLLIVGKALKDFDFEGATRLAEGDPRITFINETIAPDAVSTLFVAADVSLHCYKNITTSGTIPLAQSMGTAVIAPRIGCIQEMVPHSSGILYDPENSFRSQKCHVERDPGRCSGDGERRSQICLPTHSAELRKEARRNLSIVMNSSLRRLAMAGIASA